MAHPRRPRRRHLDREPELGAGRQQDADTGQRRPNPDVTERQDSLRGAQHRQRIAGDCLAKRHGLHERVGARLATHSAGACATIILRYSSVNLLISGFLMS